MIVIVCADDNLGMLFNNRRQSRDKVLIKKITELTKGKRLWMNSYSYSLFDEEQYDGICLDEEFLSKAEEGDYCFVENKELKPYERCIEKLIVFRWNRVYPSDFKLDIPLSDGVWRLLETSDFTGNSHEKITMEIYKFE